MQKKKKRDWIKIVILKPHNADILPPGFDIFFKIMTTALISLNIFTSVIGLATIVFQIYSSILTKYKF